MARFPGGDRHLITMRVIEISAFGPPEVLRPGQRATPVAGAGEALIAVSASGINRPDVVQRKGQVFPAAQAHALMESNQHVGKLALSW